MAKHVGDSIMILREYGEHVLRQDHAAPNVRLVAAHVLAGLVLRAQPHSLQCRTYGTKPRTALRFSVGGRPYALRYNEEQAALDLVEGNESSKTVRVSFTNETPQDEVLAAFAAL
jgi:hypothetical protein